MNRPATLGCRDLVLGMVSILLLTFLAYAPAWHGGFIWDDDMLLTRSPLMTSVQGLKDFWLTAKATDYFPLTLTSLWMEWHLWGLNTLGYHVVNIVLHALGAILFWRVLKQLKVPAAFLCAAVFAVHPVTVESVAWISERKNTLSLVFYLLSMLLFLKSEATQAGQPTAGENGRAVRFYWGAIGAFLCALLSKTSVVMLPFILLLCVWWLRGRVTRRDVLRTAPFFLLALVLGAITLWLQWSAHEKNTMVEHDSVAVRALGGGWALWFYLYKALVPVGLAIIYPRWAIDPNNALHYLPAVLWLVALFIFWKFRGSWSRPFLFAFLYFTLTLLPVLGVLRMSFMYFSRVADHLQYLALLGIIPCAVGGILYLLNRVRKPSVRSNSSFAPLGVAIVAILAALTWAEAGEYKSEEGLWRSTLKTNPTAWIAYNRLGDLLFVQGKLQEAADSYAASIRLKPNHSRTHNNLGNVLVRLDRSDDAIVEYREALKYSPNLIAAHNNLGIQLAKRGNYAEALEHCKRALRIRPDYADAHLTAGNACFRMGNYADSLSYYNNCVSLNTNWPEAHFNAGVAATRLGKRDEARQHFQEALRLKPDYVQAREELAALSTSVPQ